MKNKTLIGFRTNISYVLVKKSCKSKKSKKILVPSTLKRLMKDIKTAFKEKREILQLKTVNGEDLTDIRDVISGMTLIASFEIEIQEIEETEEECVNETPENIIPEKVVKSPQKSIPIDNTILEEEEDFSESYSSDEHETTVQNVQIEEETFEEEKPEVSPINQLMHDIFVDSESFDYDQVLPPQRFEHLTKKATLEEEQRKLWLDSMKNTAYDYFCDPLYDQFIHKSDIADFVSDITEKHRFSKSNGMLYRFKTVFSGPKKSGCSSLLLELMNSIIFSMASSDNWKSTFIFATDFNKLFSDDHMVFYQDLINGIFTQIINQKPVLKPVVNTIKAAFLSVVDSIGNVSLPNSLLQHPVYKSWAAKLQSLLYSLSLYWFDPTKQYDWLKLIVSLVVQIPKILGFSNCLIIIDNFENKTQIFNPTYPFEQSEKSYYNCDLWYDTLSMADYLLFSHLITIQSYPIGTEFLLMSDIVSNPLYQNRTLKISTSKGAIAINHSTFAGIPALLQHWYNLQELFDTQDTIPKNSDEYEENTHKAMILAEQMLQIIYPDLYDVQSIIRQ